MTGPNINGQKISIYNEQRKLIFENTLSISRNYQCINFESFQDDMVLEIEDSSSQFGEWSAIALKGVE